jgi:hypothetical protein
MKETLHAVGTWYFEVGWIITTALGCVIGFASGRANRLRIGYWTAASIAALGLAMLIMKHI